MSNWEKYGAPWLGLGAIILIIFIMGWLSTSRGRVGTSGAVSSGLWKCVTCRQCLNKRNVRLAKNKYCSHCNREY